MAILGIPWNSDLSLNFFILGWWIQKFRM